MRTIVSVHQAQQYRKSKVREEDVVVLAGGCFDILHEGHIAFLRESKKQGSVLFVLLESDQKIRESKGENRPAYTQSIRAQNLEKLKLIDQIVLLPYLKSNTEYDTVIFSLKPAIITTTTGDPYRIHKERQAKTLNGKVVDVITRLEDYSTTKIINKNYL